MACPRSANACAKCVSEIFPCVLPLLPSTNPPPHPLSNSGVSIITQEKDNNNTNTNRGIIIEEEGISRMGKTSSLLCCPCRCLVCGFASCMLTVLACIFVAGGLAALTLYLVFRPHVIQAAVDFADLHTFRLEPRTWILRYNLTLDVHLRNPNKRIAFHYTHVNAQAFYQDQRFASSSSSGDKMHDFFQDAGETCVLYPAFLGQSPLVGGVAAAGFRREAAENATFSIDVRIHAHMKLKVWFLSVPGPSPKIECPLRIRRRKRDTGELRPGSFYPTKCIVWF